MWSSQCTTIIFTIFTIFTNSSPCSLTAFCHSPILSLSFCKSETSFRTLSFANAIERQTRPLALFHCDQSPPQESFLEFSHDATDNIR